MTPPSSGAPNQLWALGGQWRLEARRFARVFWPNGCARPSKEAAIVVCHLLEFAEVFRRHTDIARLSHSIQRPALPSAIPGRDKRKRRLRGVTQCKMRVVSGAPKYRMIGLVPISDRRDDFARGLWHFYLFTIKLSCTPTTRPRGLRSGRRFRITLAPARGGRLRSASESQSGSGRCPGPYVATVMRAHLAWPDLFGRRCGSLHVVERVGALAVLDGESENRARDPQVRVDRSVRVSLPDQQIAEVLDP